jgi:chromosome segregation ATPase
MLGEMGDLPDQAKYKGAFAALKVQGLNKAHLIDSANTYLKILDQDRVNFKNEVNQNVEETNKEIESLKMSVQKNEDEIARIKADTQAQIDNLTRMMNNQVEKLQSVNSRNQAEIEPLEERAQKVVSKIAVYDAAASQYRAVIEGDIQKIESLIQ